MPDSNVPASAIDVAPDEPELTTNERERYYSVLSEYGKLQYEFDALQANYEKLEGSSESARAQLIRPYAWAVLRFLSVYGGTVGGLLVAQGFHVWGFHINDTVMGVVVGSTAVSAIGLVHTVVRGLFPIAAR